MSHSTKKKGFMRSLIVIVSVLLVFSTVASLFILDLVRQPEPETDYE